MYQTLSVSKPYSSRAAQATRCRLGGTIRSRKRGPDPSGLPRGLKPKLASTRPQFCNLQVRVVCAAGVPSRGDAAEQLWGSLSEKWGLVRQPGLRFQDCAEGVGLFCSAPSSAPFDIILKIPQNRVIQVDKRGLFVGWNPGPRARRYLEESIRETPILLALVIIDCLEGSHGPEWQRYLQIALMPVDDDTHPTCLQDDFLPHVGDPQIIQDVRFWKASLMTIAKKYFPDLLEPGPDGTLLLIRAFGHAWSSAVGLTPFKDEEKEEEGEERGVALVPFLDLVNHSQTPNSDIVEADSCYALEYTAPSTTLGDQMTFNYGARSNFDYFRTYGMSFPGLESDFLEIRAVPSSGWGALLQKVRYFIFGGFHESILEDEIKALNEDLKNEVSSQPFPTYVEALRDHLRDLPKVAENVLVLRYFRLRCTTWLSGITPDEQFEAWERKVPAKQFQAVAQYRNLRRSLIETVIAVLDDYLGKE